MTEKIQVVVPNRESTSEMNASLAKTLQNLEAPDTETDYEVEVSFSFMQPVDANRNKMVKNFLEDEDNKWMLMVDSDVVPPRDVLSMVEHGKPVVSAVCTIKKGRGSPLPTVMQLNEDGTTYQNVPLTEYYEKIRDDGLLQVEGAGTGCILVRRDVLENMQPPWFKFLYDEYGLLKLGEDFYFSRKVMENSDYDMYVDTTQVCGHHKKVDLTEYAETVAEVKRRCLKKKEGGE